MLLALISAGDCWISKLTSRVFRSSEYRVALVLPRGSNHAAEQAGLEISDVIVEIDGEAVTSSRELRNIVGLLRRDQDVNLRLYRNGEAMTVAAVISD